MSDEPRLEEKTISQLVEAGLSSQVKAAEEIAVDVNTDLGQAIQGEVKTASIKSKGLVVQNGIRLTELELQTDRVAVNLLSLLLGQIKLKQPINSTMRVVLSEADLNQAANTEVFINHLPSLTLEVQGQPVELMLQPPVTLKLLGDERLKVSGQVRIRQADEDEILCFKTVMSPQLHQQLLLEEFCCEPGKHITLDLAIALLQWINEQIKVPYIELNGIICHITHLKLEQGQLTMEAEAQIDQIPHLDQL